MNLEDFDSHRPHRHSKRGHRRVTGLGNTSNPSSVITPIINSRTNEFEVTNETAGIRTNKRRDLFSPPAAILRITEEFADQPAPSVFTSIKSGLGLRLVRPMANLTKYVGDNAKFKCEVEGQPIPRFTWYRNEAVLNKMVVASSRPEISSPSITKGEAAADEFNDEKYSIKDTTTNSILRLKNLEIYDRGFYRCEAENGINSVQTTGWLYVNPGENPLNQAGAVLPKYPELSFDEPGIMNENLIVENSEDQAISSQTNTEAGKIQKSLHNMGLVDSTLESKIQDALHYERSNHNIGKCLIYTGHVCKDVFSFSKNIFIKGTLTQEQLEENLKNSLSLIESFDGISADCSRYILPVLCHKTFPPCANTLYDNPRPRLLCKDECMLLENEICKKEYSIAKEQALIRHHLQTCDILPETSNEGGTDCIRLGLITPDIIIPSQECYEEPLGIDYKGIKSITKSGLRCKKWSTFKRSTHIKSTTNSAKSDTEQLIATADHNFCRNPGGLRADPWCFTEDNLSYDSCDIPKCGITPNSASNGITQKLLITLPSLGLFFGLIAVIFIVCWCQRKNKKSSKKLKANHYGNGNKSCVAAKELLSNTSETIPLQPGGLEYPTSPKSLYKNTKIPEVPFTNLNFLQELGESSFGMVFKGELKAGSMLNLQPNLLLPIAIKSLKPIANQCLRKDFEKEIQTLSPLKHPNITALLGLCHQNNLTYAIFEFLSKGDLHEFLILRSPHSDVGSSSVSDATHHSLDQADFLYMAVHIACGMEYLNDNGFVHKDLAARNCIVGDNLLVKISNLGYANQSYTNDYYKTNQGKGPQPIRWMPPEAIQYGKYSSETDAWSFGILLWEIFSYGLQPYYGYSNGEVVELIKNQQLLSSPEDCPPAIYEIMLECWNEMPSRRPSFQSLHARLRSIEIRDKSIRARSTTLSGAAARDLSGHVMNDGRYLMVTSPPIRSRDEVRGRGNRVVTSQSPYPPAPPPQMLVFRHEGGTDPTSYYHHVIPPAPRNVLKPPPYGGHMTRLDRGGEWVKNNLSDRGPPGEYSKESLVSPKGSEAGAQNTLFYARSRDINQMGDHNIIDGNGALVRNNQLKNAGHQSNRIAYETSSSESRSSNQS